MYYYNCLLCIAYNCCIAYRIFLLCGISVTGHFPCMIYPWYFCVFGPLTFEPDLPIFSIPCAGVTCMFYCTPFSGCFRGGHACFSFSHFLRFSHFIFPSPMFLKAKRPRHRKRERSPHRAGDQSDKSRWQKKGHPCFPKAKRPRPQKRKRSPHRAGDQSDQGRREEKGHPCFPKAKHKIDMYRINL